MSVNHSNDNANFSHYSPGKLPPTGSPEPPESILVLEDMRSSGYRVSLFDYSKVALTSRVFSGRELRERLESRASRIRNQGHCDGSCAIVGHEVQGEGRSERKIPGE